MELTCLEALDLPEKELRIDSVISLRAFKFIDESFNVTHINVSEAESAPPHNTLGA